MLNEKNLEKLLKEKNVNFELLKFEESVTSSEKAQKQVQGIMVKSILLIVDNSSFVLHTFR